YVQAVYKSQRSCYLSIILLDYITKTVYTTDMSRSVLSPADMAVSGDTDCFLFRYYLTNHKNQIMSIILNLNNIVLCKE
ncbi:MAG: hypothetical protein J1E32_07545, partial [Treponema sp.]|nr:hypothetical protein [Treponema sp.]